MANCTRNLLYRKHVIPQGRIQEASVNIRRYKPERVRKAQQVSSKSPVVSHRMFSKMISSSKKKLGNKEAKNMQQAEMRWT